MRVREIAWIVCSKVATSCICVAAHFMVSRVLLQRSLVVTNADDLMEVNGDELLKAAQ